MGLLASKTETLDEAFDGKRKKGDSKCTHHLKQEAGDDDEDEWCHDEKLTNYFKDNGDKCSLTDLADLVNNANANTCKLKFDKHEIDDYAKDECEDAEDDIEDFCDGEVDEYMDTNNINFELMLFQTSIARDPYPLFPSFGVFQN